MSPSSTFHHPFLSDDKWTKSQVAGFCRYLRRRNKPQTEIKTNSALTTISFAALSTQKSPNSCCFLLTSASIRTGTILSARVPRAKLFPSSVNTCPRETNRKSFLPRRCQESSIFDRLRNKMKIETLQKQWHRCFSCCLSHLTGRC